MISDKHDLGFKKNQTMHSARTRIHRVQFMVVVDAGNEIKKMVRWSNKLITDP